MKYDSVLWYDRPADYWEGALPIGNGRLGAMVYGRVSEECIQLNEDTLWSGLPNDAVKPGFADILAESRRLLQERRFSEADIFMRQLGDRECESYVTAGCLKIGFGESGTITDYRRSLDLDRAVAVTTCRRDARLHEVCAFASVPDQVIAVRVTTGASPVHLALEAPLETESGFHANDLFLNGQCPFHDRYDRVTMTDELGRGGIRYQIRVRVIGKEIRLRKTAPKNTVEFMGGPSFTLLIAIRSDFIDFRTMPGSDGVSPEEKCLADLDAAERHDFDLLSERHRLDYEPLFARSRLHLGNRPEDSLPTDRRLAEKEKSPGLAALLYQYGRYLLLCSSRPGTQAANLQGIWNHLLCPPWGSNYTTNINLEMNYWLAEPTGLAECAEPLFRLIEEVAERGTAVARGYYGCGGWCLHQNSDLWRFAVTATRRTQWLFWPMAGVWLVRHLYDHYRYGGDVDFLRKSYPLIRGAAEFVLDYLVQNEKGQYLTEPATSPENQFVDPESGEPAAAATGSAMDQELIAELLENLAEAAAALEISGDEIVRRAEEMLPLLSPVGIGRHGQILEYGEEFEEFEVHHRHLSHLYAAYPGNSWTPRRNADLYQAARISLERRGDQGTGWAMAWRAALWARFRDGNRAGQLIDRLLTLLEPGSEKLPGHEEAGGVYLNLFDACPPFQIDGNFGVAAAVMEMLVQSHCMNAEGVRLLELLPALPSNWMEGRLTGVRLPDGWKLDFEWKESRVTEVRLQSSRAAKLQLCVNGEERLLEAPSSPQEQIFRFPKQKTGSAISPDNSGR